MLGDLGRSDEAIAVYDDLVDRFGTPTDRALRELVATAYGRSDEAIAGLPTTSSTASAPQAMKLRYRDGYACWFAARAPLHGRHYGLDGMTGGSWPASSNGTARQAWN